MRSQRDVAEMNEGGYENETSEHMVYTRDSFLVPRANSEDQEDQEDQAEGI